MRLRQVMVAVVAFWMIAALVPATASAADFRLRVEKITSAGAVGTVVEDEGINDESPFAEGVISINLDGISFTTAYTKPDRGYDPSLGLFADLTVDAFRATSTGPATIKLTLEDTGYPGGVDGDGNPNVFNIPLALKSGLTLNTFDPLNPTGIKGNVTVDVKTYAAATYVPNLGTLQGFGDISGNPTGGTPSGYIGMVSTTGTSSGLAYLDQYEHFNMFTEITLTFGDGGGDINFTQVSRLIDPNGALGPGPQETPEPTSLLLLSSGVIGLAATARRRLKQTRG